MPEGGVVGFKLGGALGQAGSPLGPLDAVEGFQCLACLVPQLLLFAVQQRQQALAHWVTGRGELSHPVHHHMQVAETPEPAEEAPAGLAHGLPVTLRVELHQAIRQRAAAPQRHAQVMHRIRREPLLDAVALLQHAAHPVAEAGAVLPRLVQVGHGWVWTGRSGPLCYRDNAFARQFCKLRPGRYNSHDAGVAELADASDSKSDGT